MGYQTDADRKRDEAKEHIQQAIISLHEATHPEIDGYMDWSEDYQTKLAEAKVALIQVKGKL